MAQYGSYPAFVALKRSPGCLSVVRRDPSRTIRLLDREHAGATQVTASSRPRWFVLPIRLRSPEQSNSQDPDEKSWSVEVDAVFRVLNAGGGVAG
jgi:hypothetical protein